LKPGQFIEEVLEMRKEGVYGEINEICSGIV
jgi:hypothetical protein